MGGGGDLKPWHLFVPALGLLELMKPPEAPKPPKRPDPIDPNEQHKKAAEAAALQASKAKAKTGYSSTKKTGPLGLGEVDDENTGKATLLGN